VFVYCLYTAWRSHNYEIGLATHFSERIHVIKHLESTGYVMHQQFNIQQLYALPTRNRGVLEISVDQQGHVRGTGYIK
jgi:hypothetical protein